MAFNPDLCPIATSMPSSNANRHAARKDRSDPGHLDDWLRHHRARVLAKSPRGEALATIAKYRDGPGRYVTEDRIQIDSNTVERTTRPIAFLAGHHTRAKIREGIALLITTCNMNTVNPDARLTKTLRAIVNGLKQTQINDLPPRNCAFKV